MNKFFINNAKKNFGLDAIYLDSLAFLFLLVNMLNLLNTIWIYSRYFLGYPWSYLISNKSIKNTNRDSYIKATNIKYIYIRNIYIKNICTSDISAKNIYIKSAFIKSIDGKSVYIKSDSFGYALIISIFIINVTIEGI